MTSHRYVIAACNAACQNCGTAVPTACTCSCVDGKFGDYCQRKHSPSSWTLFTPNESEHESDVFFSNSYLALAVVIFSWTVYIASWQAMKEILPFAFTSMRFRARYLKQMSVILNGVECDFWNYL